MKSINEITTPACLLDQVKFEKNCARMQNVIEHEGLSFRPHVKTLKSLQAAEFYAPEGSPITVSTLAEASYFAAAGYTDILYAVGISPNKFVHIPSLQKLAPDFTVVVDSQQAVKALVEFAPTLDKPLSVMLEVDVDDHRAGLLPTASELLSCAQALESSPNLHFRGVMTHAGGSYDCFTAETQQAMAIQECTRISQSADFLAQHGIQCEVISAGSTPTALANVSHEGITELRAGVYATFDCVMAGMGVCQFEDISLSVLTTVIGHQRDKNWVIIDAGWMALSRDQGTANHKLDCGYGLVCDADGRILDGWYVSSTNQEHGIICHRDGLTPPDEWFAYGSLLRILPIHACATAAQFDRYFVVDSDGQPSQIWSRVNGW